MECPSCSGLHDKRSGDLCRCEGLRLVLNHRVIVIESEFDVERHIKMVAISGILMAEVSFPGDCGRTCVLL